MVSPVVAKISGITAEMRALQGPTCALPFCVPEVDPPLAQASLDILHKVATVAAACKLENPKVDPKDVFVFIMDAHEDLTLLFTGLKDGHIQLPKEMLSSFKSFAEFKSLAEFAKTHFRQAAMERGAKVAIPLDKALTELRAETKAPIPLIHCDVFLDHTEWDNFLEDTIKAYNNTATSSSKFRNAVNTDAKNFLSRKHGFQVNEIDLDNPLHAVAVLYVLRENAMLRLWAKANTANCQWKTINFVPHTHFNSSMTYTFKELKHGKLAFYPLTYEVMAREASITDQMEDLTLGDSAFVNGHHRASSGGSYTFPNGNSMASSSSASASNGHTNGNSHATSNAHPASSVVSIASAAALTEASTSHTLKLTRHFVGKSAASDVKIYRLACEEFLNLLSGVKKKVETVSRGTRDFKRELVDNLQNICATLQMKIDLPSNWDDLLSEPASPPNTMVEMICDGVIKSLEGINQKLDNSCSEDTNAQAYLTQSAQKKSFAKVISEILAKAIGADFDQKSAKFRVSIDSSANHSPTTLSDDDASSPRSKPMQP